MTTLEDDEQDVNIPDLAARALTEAHRRAVSAGHPVVLVQGGQLVRREGDRLIVLKPIRGRKKVTIRVKQRKP